MGECSKCKVQTTRILKICFAPNLSLKLQNDHLPNRSGIVYFNFCNDLLTVEKVNKKKKDKLFSVHTMKTCRGNRGIAPPILKLEVPGQLHTLAAVSLEKGSDTDCIGDWVGTVDRLDV